MTPKHIPQIAAQFYDACLSKLSAARKAREDAAIRRTMFNQDRLDALSDAFTRGKQAAAFMQTDFWIDNLEPWLRSESVLKPFSIKDGEPAPVDRLNIEYLIGSGKVGVITRMIDRMGKWIAEGEEAEKLLKLEAEKKRVLDEVRA